MAVTAATAAACFLVATEGLNTLIDFRFTRNFRAQRRCSRVVARTVPVRVEKILILQVPVGTTVLDEETGESTR